MQRWNTKRIVLSLITLITLIVSCGYFDGVFAIAPSFSYREIKDDAFNWIDMNNNQSRSISETPPIFGHPYSDLLSVNYFSNGDTLNAVLWFKYLFNKSVLINDSSGINYGIFIDADANKETGVGGIDYQVEISGQNGKWTRTLSQWSSIGTNRILSKENYTDTNFFVNNGSYILLSADLSSMGSPDKYRMIFYAEQISGSVWLVDATNWVHIPQPEFDISASPNSLDISQGDNKTIIIQIKSTTGFTPTVKLYSENLKTSNMKLNFYPNEITVPSYGINSSRAYLYVPPDSELSTHVVNILANATFSSEPFFLPLSNSFNSLTKENFKVPPIEKSEIITKQTDLTINVKTGLGKNSRMVKQMAISHNFCLWHYYWKHHTMGCKEYQEGKE